MGRSGIAGTIAVFIILSLWVTPVMAAANPAQPSYMAAAATQVNGSGNASYIRLTHVIPTNTTYYGFHQVGSSNEGLTDQLYYTGAFSGNGSIFYVTTGSMSVSEVNTTSWSTIRTVQVPSSATVKVNYQSREWIDNMAFDPSNGMLYATVVKNVNIPFKVFDNSYLFEINPGNGSIVGSIPLYNYSSGIVYDQQNGMLYATSVVWNLNSSPIPSSSYLMEINPSTMSPVGSFAFPGFVLKQIAYNGARDQIYAPCFNGTLTVFNTTTGQMANITLSPHLYAPSYVAYSPDYIYVVYIGALNVSVVNEKSLNFAYNISLPDEIFATSAAYDPGTSSLYISDMNGNIHQINTVTGRDVCRVSTGTVTQDLQYSNGNVYAVGSGKQAYFSVLGTGPVHRYTFRAYSVFGHVDWTVVANGVQYSSANGSVTFSAAGNSIQYYVVTYQSYLVLPWAGTLSGSSGAGVTMVFFNFFLVLALAIGAIAGAITLRISRKRRRG